MSAAATAGTSSGTSGTSDVSTTFLNLLIKELQNQDPTAPMDSTAMVGQMISLNQLEQLTSINQAVGGSATALSGAVQTPANVVSDPALTRVSTLPIVSSATSPATTALDQLPFDPNTMMPKDASAFAPR